MDDEKCGSRGPASSRVLWEAADLHAPVQPRGSVVFQVICDFMEVVLSGSSTRAVNRKRAAAPAAAMHPRWTEGSGVLVAKMRFTGLERRRLAFMVKYKSIKLASYVIQLYYYQVQRQEEC